MSDNYSIIGGGRPEGSYAVVAGGSGNIIMKKPLWSWRFGRWALTVSRRTK